MNDCDDNEKVVVFEKITEINTMEMPMGFNAPFLDLIGELWIQNLPVYLCIVFVYLYFKS